MSVKGHSILMRNIGNSITPMIQLEEDIPSSHQDQKLPILDLEVWVERSKLKHNFYKKPMASRRVILARSAGPNSEKRAILVQECLRRLRNCSEDIQWSSKAEYVSQLMLDMKHAGHSQHFRETVAKKAIKKYQAQLEDHKAGKKSFYRNRTEIKLDERKRGGKAKKDNWFRHEGFTSTLRVMPTPESQLAKNTAEAMAKCPPPLETKTKVVEQGGSTVGNQLIRSNPFPRNHCNRVHCGLCHEGGSKGKCYRANIGYEYVCKRCEEKNKQEIENGTSINLVTSFKYIGETSRTAFTRHNQHQSKYKTSSRQRDKYTREKEEAGETTGTFMWSHTRDYHGGVLGPEDGKNDYIMSQNGIFNDTMTRQVDEDVRMRLSGWGANRICRKNSEPQCVLMNSKTAFFNPKSVQTIFKQL